MTKEGKEQCVNLSNHDGVCEQEPGMAPEAASSNCRDSEVVCDNNNDVAAADQEEHLPAGQHLLMDIQNVNAGFLDSEERLANAMLELVDQCGLTLLSYHCHKLKPSGVSCAGVLLESHVSFHTWPRAGVITLDLFTCGPNSLLPVVPLAEQLFAVPSSQSTTLPPKVIWAHKIRGFAEGDGMDISETTDMQWFPIGMMTEYKEEASNWKQYVILLYFFCSGLTFVVLLSLDCFCENKIPTGGYL